MNKSGEQELLDLSWTNYEVCRCQLNSQSLESVERVISVQRRFKVLEAKVGNSIQLQSENSRSFCKNG